MSRLLHLMKHGALVTRIAANTAGDIRLKRATPRRRLKLMRNYRNEVERIRDMERLAYEEIMSRPCDIEESRDLELMMVVSNLTGFRLNRLAYAGRVLP